MPIKIPDGLPATQTFDRENIFYMTEHRASCQDIRPLRIVVLNLMPAKIETETQLLRLLGNTPLQVDVEFMQTESYQPTHVSAEHLLKFYKPFSELRNERFDGMIITGAPVENLPFESVDYWQELCEIMEWSKTNVYSTFHICWAAQAGLYYHYGIKKYPLSRKMFGLFSHRVLEPTHPLVRGFDEQFWAPHSRHTEVRSSDIRADMRLRLLSESDEAGAYIAVSRDNRQVFVTGHSEYDRNTMAGEYFRDLNKGLDIQLPRSYFPGDDPSREPPMVWRGHANLLYSNWLNYCVYQETPYSLDELV